MTETPEVAEEAVQQPEVREAPQRLEKRHVVLVDAGGNVAHDYVCVDLVPHYLEDATKPRQVINGDEVVQRWAQAFVVSDAHDPGPGGDDGATHIPAHLFHLVANHPVLGKLPASHGPMLSEAHVIDDGSDTLPGTHAGTRRVLALLVANPHHIDPADCPECTKPGGQLANEKGTA